MDIPDGIAAYSDILPFKAIFVSLIQNTGIQTFLLESLDS
jgi:hypothetical protein